MLTVISPAKTLNFETPSACTDFTRPKFLSQSRKLIQILGTKTNEDIKSLMSLSDNLAELNVDRYRKWKAPAKIGATARQAIYAFMGDVYQVLDFSSLKPSDRPFAQANLRILSGLYGILKPLDLIAPHRLEMGTSLSNEYGRSLYAFWGDTQTRFINREIKNHDNPTLLNLASDEYFKVIKPKTLKARIVTPRFLDSNDGKTYKVMSFYAKRARGAMTRWVIENRIDSSEQIVEFKADRYRYDSKRSEENQPVFTRSHA